MSYRTFSTYNLYQVITGSYRRETAQCLECQR